MSRPRPIAPVSAGTSLRPQLLAAGLIALGVVLAYANSFRVPFLFDDQSAILRNATIRDLWSFDVFAAPLNATGATGRPLVNLSLALNYALGGTDVRGYHLLNLALHLASALLLFGLIRRTLLRVGAGVPACPSESITPDPAGRDACRYGDTALPVATATALLWAVHPLQTESVTCIIQRTELLGGGFLLLTLYCFMRATQAASPGATHFWSVAAVTACTLGMAAKEFMVVAPVLALLYDRSFAAGSFRAAWQRRRGLHLGLAASWLILAALLVANPQRNHNVGFGLGISAWDYLLTQCRALVLYLQLAVWPHPLVMDYGAPVVHSLAAVWPQAVLLVALAAGTLWALRRHPAASFVGACFFVVLAPSSSFVPLTTQTIAEHRMYLPLLCLILPAVLLLWRHTARFAALICGGLALAAIGLTWQRNTVYATRLSIWTDTAASAPDNYRAHYNLGNARVAAGQPAAAVPSFEAALKLKPDDGSIAYNLASVLQQLGRDAEAVGYFETALRHGPEAADTHANLAVALARTGRIDEAVAHFRRATALEPKAPDLHFSLAQALRLQGRIAEAVQEYRTVLQLEPRHSPARAALAEITGNPR